MTEAIGLTGELYVKERGIKIILGFSPQQPIERRKGKCRMVERNQELFGCVMCEILLPYECRELNLAIGTCVFYCCVTTYHNLTA